MTGVWLRRFRKDGTWGEKDIDLHDARDFYFCSGSGGSNGVDNVGGSSVFRRMFFSVMEVDCSRVVFLAGGFCGGVGGNGSEEFQTHGGVCSKAGLVVFEWKGSFLYKNITRNSFPFEHHQTSLDVGGTECV